MKTFSFIFAALLISTIGFSQDIKASYNIDDSKIALQGYSPVSYLDLGIALKPTLRSICRNTEATVRLAYPLGQNSESTPINLW